MSDRPLRILAVTHEAIRNGAPLVAVQVLQWLQAERGYEIETLVLSDGPLVRDFARIGATHVIPLNDPDEMLVAWRDEAEPSAAKIATFAELERTRGEALRPDVAHLTGFDVLYLNSATSARALRILPEVPPVVIAHIHELDGAYNHWFEPEDREALMRTDPSYVVVGNRVGQNLVENHGVDPARITVVRNEFARPTAPADVEVTRLRARLGLAGDEVVIGAMGSAEWRKGPDLFVQMAAVVSRRLPDTKVQFYWVGRTDEYHLRQYETDAARLGLADRLRFVGEQSDAASWLRVFDLFCLTSREDPFPLVCLEAGALGVPVISFDNGGMAELTAEAGGAEPLIEIIDYLDVEDMADAVAMRIQDPARRARDGQRLQAWLDEHLFVAGSVGRIAEVIEDRVGCGPRPVGSGDGMNLFAPVGHRRSIMLTAPSAVRDDSTTSLLSFVKWARNTVAAPPRVVVLSGGIMQKDFRAVGARVIDDPKSPVRTVERALRKLGYPRLSTVVRRGMHATIFQQPLQPRCVYASTVHGAGPALRHLPKGARLVVHAYETGDMLDQFIDDAMMKRLASGVSTWVAASDGVADGLVERGVDPAAIERCSPFIDPPATDSPKTEAAMAELVRLGVQPGEVIVGGIGHSDWRDAPDLFLRVAAMMRRRYPELPLRFVWVGAPDDGPTRWILEHDIRHAGLSDSVILIGNLDDGETWLSTFDILCLTSRVDPPPPTGLQAGALGIPVVGFAQSGLLELEDELGDGHGIEGVPYLDIEAMSEKIAELATDPDARRAAGAEFRRIVLESHLTENRAQALWDLLEREARAAGH